MGRRNKYDAEIRNKRSLVPDALKKKAARPVAKQYGVGLVETYTDEQREFLMAMDTLKKEVGPHPTWDQVLRKAREMGYRKIDHQE